MLEEPVVDGWMDVAQDSAHLFKILCIVTEISDSLRSKDIFFSLAEVQLPSTEGAC